MSTPISKNNFLNDPFSDEYYSLLFNELYTPLCRYCMKFVNDSDVAEDIVQEQFIYIWERRVKLKHTSSIKAYLTKAVKNRSLNYLRDQFVRKTDQQPEVVAKFEAKYELPSEILEFKELEALLEKGIESLPIKCRTIFAMKRFAGMTNREISENLQISIKTVETQMTIALKKLSTFVSKNWGLFTLALINYLHSVL